MSIIGIDFGNESCLITSAKSGFIETLTNDYGLRATPSYIAFDNRKRIIGLAAKNQQLANMSNTLWGFKHLLGRKFIDPYVQREFTFVPIPAQQLPDGGIGVKVNYLGKETIFTPIQIVAMMLNKLKEIAVNSLQTQIGACVITCPVFFTNAERKALLDACQIAGLNVLRLMNETTATALHYGFYKTDLSEDKSRNVIFIDCGHSSLQASVCAFTQDKLKILASTWDIIGGRDFDVVLAQYFANEFKEQYNINVHSNPRAFTRLLNEVEKLKRQMSVNNTRLPLVIECFINDIDLQSNMQRSLMDKLCLHLYKRIEMTFRKLLQESKLALNDIHAVEIVGGSTRIPAIKLLIEEVFHQKPCTTLNQDESVSSGATLQCAMMSPQMHVRNFDIFDIQNFAVKVSCDGEDGDMIVFRQYHTIPASIALNFNRRESFVLALEYAQEVPCLEPLIGKWLIKNNKSNEPQEIRVKARVNQHGIVLITRAHLVDRTVVNNDGREDQESSQENEENKKKPFKMFELPVEAKTIGYTPGELHELIKQEAKMSAMDAREKERANARNALEEYIYEMRSKLCEGGSLEQYLLKGERDHFCSRLQELAVWLYDEGENCERHAYIERLNNLRGETDYVNARARDFENYAKALDDLKKSLMWVSESLQGLAQCQQNISDPEKINISQLYEKTQNWFETHFAIYRQLPRTSTCYLNIDDIQRQIQELKVTFNEFLKSQQTTQNMELENENQNTEPSNANEQIANNIDANNSNRNNYLDLD